ncbi:MAG: PQQ-binding-like beta-propeller repeat protein, partial [Blastocatellia bacterium]
VFTDGKIALLIDTPEAAYLAAFDAGSGKQVWRTERPVGVLGSYATPTVYARAGEPAQIVVAGATELTGYQVRTGERLWWARGVTISPNAPPFVAEDSVYTVETAGIAWPPFGNPLNLFDRDKNGRIEIAEATSDPAWAGSLKSIDKNLGNGDGVVTEEEYAKASTDESSGGGLVRTRIGGRGDVSGNVAWRYTKGMPSLTGALLYQNALYVIRSGILSVFDPETGRLLRQERIKNAPGDYYASPVAADDKIYLANLEGRVTVLKAGADAQVVSTGDLGEQIVATPAIAGGRVYFRTEGTLFCFGTRKR